MTATSPARNKHEPRVEDDALVRGHGQFHGRPATAEPSLCRLRALAARPCPRQVGKDRSGARRQTRARRTDRRGHDGGRRRQRLAPSTGGRPRRRQDDHAVPPRARRRHGDAWRRAGGDGGGGNARGGAGRRRTGRRRLRGIAGRGRPGNGDARQDAAPRRSARQSLHRLAGAGGRRAEHPRGGRDFRQGGACGARQRRQSAPGGGFVGNARRHRRLRCGQRQLHAVCLFAGCGPAARHGRRHHGHPS